MADAVVIPGRLFGPGAPLLMYTGDVARSRGAVVHRREWTEKPPEGLDDYDRWVRAQILPLPAGQPLLIGKSLGTHAAALAAERDLPAVWLTPLLWHPPVVAALARATAPFLLVGGGADPSWDGGAGRRLTPHVFEVPGADHGMYVPGPVTASIAVLAQVVGAMAEFLDEIGWPHR
ncbi:alpha/beta hydrolase [Actinoplanes subtropicus]|uniref:alpha/beta hydrolase n=1 Tax=Actinoplanes subtropicus TaxID=543632 RepID=UPI0004C2FFFE|nr:alpha/beta hydrolase [Actinoplanes subtropicus]